MKKILKSVLVFVLIVPFVFLLTACGNTKSLDGKLYIFDHIVVTGDLKEEDVKDDYASMTLTFDETTVDYYNGPGNEDTYDYKVENKKLYIKSTSETEYSETEFAELSGKYLVKVSTRAGGTVKVYFKAK